MMAHTGGNSAQERDDSGEQETSRVEQATSFVLDSGATTHAVNTTHLFSTFTACDTTIRLAAETAVQRAEGIGRIDLPDCDFGLGEVLFTPNFHVNIMSARRLAKNGCIIVIENERASCTMNDELLFYAYPEARLDGLYVVDLKGAAQLSADRRDARATAERLLNMELPAVERVEANCTTNEDEEPPELLATGEGSELPAVEPEESDEQYLRERKLYWGLYY
jgi:hypothetical protein